MSKSQELKESPELAGKDKEIHDKIQDLYKSTVTESTVRAFEAENREVILGSSLAVRDLFDRLWKTTTGRSYFQPVTVVEEQTPIDWRHNITTPTLDPKSQDYRVQEVFSEILWSTQRIRLRKKFTTFYSISGIMKRTGMERPIFNSLLGNQLRDKLGDDLTKKILDPELSREGRGRIPVPGGIYLPVEGYWMVWFLPQRDEKDTKDVQLLWETQCLLFQRQVQVIVPGFYLEAADNTTYPLYTQTPEQGRKIVGEAQTYPYRVHREATIEEYIKMKEEGDKIQRAAIKKQESTI